MQGSDIAGATVRISIPRWMALREGLASMTMEGKVLATSPRAFQFVGAAVVTESDFCHRCGLEISNPVSRLAGYGPECSKKLGIPRDFTPEQIADIREAVKVNTTITKWFPLSKTVVEVLAKGEAPPMANPQVRIVGTAKPGVLAVHAPYRFKDICKSLGGRKWDADAKVWTIPASPATIQEAIVAFQRVGQRIEFDEVASALIGQAQTIIDAAVHKDAADLPPVPISNTDAWLHQRQAFWFAKDLNACMLAMDMGTGKSKVVVDLIVNCDDRLVLIVAPLSVVNVWPNQFAIHAGKPVKTVVLTGSSLQVEKTIRKSIAEQAGHGLPLVLITNYEKLDYNNGLGPWTDPKSGRVVKPGVLEEIPWDRLVIDESHKVKAPNGTRSNILARIAAVAKRKNALTGTPMPHSPLDIFGQYRALDPGIFGTYFGGFRQRYAVMGGYAGKQVLGYQNEEELNRKVYSIGYRVTKDVLDLPSTVHSTRLVTLSAKARKVYRDIEKELLADLESGATVTVDNVLVKLLRMQQVTSGHVGIDGGGTEHVDTAKETALLDVLEEAGDQPIVVFTRFVHDLDAVKRVAEKAGRRYAELSGRDKSGLNDKSQMAEGVDVLGVQIQSGGVGIDLTRAAVGVYYSIGFSLGDYEQSLARIHRPGQTKTTNYVHILAAQSIDERVYELLADRKDVVEDILSHGLDVVRGAESIGLQSARRTAENRSEDGFTVGDAIALGGSMIAAQETGREVYDAPGRSFNYDGLDDDRDDWM